MCSAFSSIYQMGREERQIVVNHDRIKLFSFDGDDI